MVSLLLSFGADPNKHSTPRLPSTLSPLEMAIGCGHPRLVAQLIHAGADVTLDSIVFLSKIQSTKKSIDQSRRDISDGDLGQMKDLLAVKPCLKDHATYERAKAAERAFDYHRALELLRSVNAEHPCTQIKFDMERIAEAIYGVKGSDCTISIWDSVPLMTHTEPTHYQDYAWTQLGRKIYRHGGVDKSGKIEQREELWELDIDSRVWRLLKTGGKTPGKRFGHTMWAWKDSLYVWGGRVDTGALDAKLYRLSMKTGGQLAWEIVKTAMRPPGREYHAGALYTDKYYITCGNAGVDGWDLTNDTWALNMSSRKWVALKDGPIERHCHGMWAANNKLYVLGGRRFHVDLLKVKSQHATHSIEKFASFDLKAKKWSDEPIIGDRPFDTSEFTVIPLYANEESENDCEPSSVIVWGGYHELDRKGPCAHSKAREPMMQVYGAEWLEFHCQYLSRLLRFYPDTMVWTKLRPTTTLLPKAQSFGAVVKADGGSIRLLIGGGYGFVGESMAEEPEECDGDYYSTPISSNEVFSVITGDPGDNYAALDSIEGSEFQSHLKSDAVGESWAWQFCDQARDKMPQYVMDFSPCSPVLHDATDYTHEDFADPPCDIVKHNDIDTLLGVRVQIHGLVTRRDLNGKTGRILHWADRTERYEVFIPNYEGGPCTIAVKPSNLKIADKIEHLEQSDIQELMARCSGMPQRFPFVQMVLDMPYDTSKVKRPLHDQIVNPASHSGEPIHLFDEYSGPVSRRAQAILRKVSLPESIVSSGPNPMPEFIRSYNLVVMLSPDFSEVNESHRVEMTKHLNLYSRFVNQLKEKDSIRARELESRARGISDSEVAERCGKWLRLKVSIDGMEPKISRELVVNPDVSMQSLHHQVLCPAIGWKSYNHSYGFRRSGISCFSDDGADQHTRTKEEHAKAIEVMDREIWIGPKKSNAVDSMFMPLYIGGCFANDKEITLGQLFALNDNISKDKMLLQWVNDIGDWSSHSIVVSKCDEREREKIPSNATVAHLLRGEGGSIPEGIGGVQRYYELILQLTGKLPLDGDVRMGNRSNVDPCSGEWWTLFNGKFRSKSNRSNFLSSRGPLFFDLDQARSNLETEIRRPRPKNINEGHARKYDRQSGLTYDMGTKCTIDRPKKGTDVCAFCGVTVALKKCSACETVAYCSKEHAEANWPIHRAECKKARKRRSKKR